MTAYYNEFDPKAAAWLRQLIKNGLIAHGEVDERSIVDVEASDLRGFKQHHFFAGIGVWSYSLRNAGWSDDTPVCTASLPCQPFSVAGNQLGKKDERHLLPHFIELVKQCKFDIIFGEQVESAIRHGWLDDLQATMERENYAVGHCTLGAHSTNSPHKRQRLFWVADSLKPRQQGRLSRGAHKKRQNIDRYSGCDSTDSGLEKIEWLYCKDGKRRPVKSGIEPLVTGLARGMVYRGGPINANATSYARATRLKGYGTAINADVAREFISAYMDVVQ
jgi:DNA (cytosine-5)-methyltransferase 1